MAAADDGSSDDNNDDDDDDDDAALDDAEEDSGSHSSALNGEGEGDWTELDAARAAKRIMHMRLDLTEPLAAAPAFGARAWFGEARPPPLATHTHTHTQAGHRHVTFAGTQSARVYNWRLHTLSEFPSQNPLLKCAWLQQRPQVRNTLMP
jgi:hypothetical protein